MEITRTVLIEHLGSMTVMEMCDLTRDLEETWGVNSSVAPIATPFVQYDSVEEQTEFDVVLESFGEKKISVIRVLRAEIPGLLLKEAKLLAESAPTPVKEGVTKQEADDFKTKLEEAGATVVIK